MPYCVLRYEHWTNKPESCSSHQLQCPKKVSRKKSVPKNCPEKSFPICYLHLPPVAVFGLVNVWPGWRQSRLQCVQQNSSYVWRCWWWGPQFCFSSTWADQVVSKVGRVDKTAHLASTSSTWSWSWSSLSSTWLSSSTATSIEKSSSQSH